MLNGPELRMRFGTQKGGYRSSADHPRLTAKDEHSRQTLYTTGCTRRSLLFLKGAAARDVMSASHMDRAGAMGRTRPLCVYPKVAKYKGSGRDDAGRSHPRCCNNTSA